MFNLKEIKEEWLNKINLLKYISSYDIYYYYIGHFDIGKPFSSPFRTDKTPSFNIYIAYDGELIHQDFKLGSGNCIRFVSIMENCGYFDALSILNERYKIGLVDLNKNKIKSNYTKTPLITNVKVYEKAEVWIDIKVRQWELHDKEYWSKYEISKATLEYFDVFPVQRFWINDARINANKHCYAYYYEPRVYKVYQPYLEVGSGKWWSNIKNKEVYQGHNQLLDAGDILFITSSLKDVMVLYECGYNAVAPHTEHQILSDGLYQQYSSNFDLVLVLYDNDSAGILHANKMVEKYNIKSLVLPDSDTKDPSDFVEKYDLETLKSWILNKI